MTFRTDGVTPGVVTAAGWAWRLAVLAGFGYGVFWLLGHFSEVTIPIAIACLFTAALFPVWQFMINKGLSQTLASAVAVLGMVLVTIGVFTWVGAMVVGELPQLADQTIKGINGVMAWLADGPLAINKTQIDAYMNQFTTWATQSRQLFASWAGKVGASVGNFLTGSIICLITTFFFLKDGRKIFDGLLWLVPQRFRGSAERGSISGWKSLVIFMGAAVTVAFVDALGVLIACLILGTPLPWAIFALTFIVSFIPVVGAVLAGFVAVLLTLITHGVWYGVAMLVAVILVMNLESSFLQPMLLGRAVSLHPLAVIFGLAIGASVGGIVGAIIAGPIMAFVVAFVRANTGAPGSAGADVVMADIQDDSEPSTN